MNTVEKNGIVELAFTASGTDPNPYMTAGMSVSFTAPSGKSFTTGGFWDGGQHWKARFAPDETGQWHWHSRSADAGLDGASGGFEVGPTLSASPWRVHGPLSLHPSARGFSHADGVPVFWLADTVWSVPAHATLEEWRHYLTRRAAQGFNVVQINSLPQWDASGPPLRQPFLTTEGKEDVSHPDPTYFRFLDQVVAMAAAAGMIASIVLLWFENTPGDNEHWNIKVKRRGPFTAETARAHARHLVARYEAFGATWIVSGDSSYNTPASTDLYDLTGEVVRAVSARPPMTTTHLNGGTAPSPELNARSWLDFNIFQSCHFRDSAERARTYATLARSFVPARPVLNSEPCYDSLRMMDADNTAGHRFSREDVRRASWISLLSGANAGLTYGAHGTWPWHRDGQDYGAIHYGLPLDWRMALDLESGDDMTRIKAFFEGLPWWDIAPAAGAVCDPPQAHLATAKAGASTLLVYVQGPVKVGLPSLILTDAASFWFDPSMGKTTDAKPDVDGYFHTWSLAEAAKDRVLMVTNAKLQSGAILPISPS